MPIMLPDVDDDTERPATRLENVAAAILWVTLIAVLAFFFVTP